VREATSDVPDPVGVDGDWFWVETHLAEAVVAEEVAVVAAALAEVKVVEAMAEATGAEATAVKRRI
jgi:hypothetical protein